ncbi:hypothetical protein [Burkholderia pseudomultivorans]|uniref:hypothetical protein n=1 Tax=Burkholderia pseudomultivorans TaxID=1207504 RepID=UPI000841B406|nr:hypothetical protein [Burkholderia pseudomultivorans]AOI92098.1 hypothetical protein WS57_25650 [Burkholderia pseudomultivorans]
MPATSIALVASTQSSIAAANAARAEAEAHTARCIADLASYNQATADVSRSQSYAECVLYLHPTTTPSELLGMKIGIAALLVMVVIGIVMGVLKGREDVCMGPWIGAFFGGCIAGCAWLGGSLLLAAVGFIVS